ncbi:NUDIX hydrolase [Flexibacterium corallicola]|uniref:NUDIX hydrolase n=1 Tax=Flexibacterium corallicola TaxID=3037259 RepID=UPI00286F14DA|nr:NUDIX hydrolase [Pseudovibrio sp. M1P-2-3]
MKTVTIPLSGLFEVHTQRDQVNAEKMTKLINGRGNAFSRDPAYDHVTASAFILNEERSKVLLTHHAKLGKWFQLGGHCDGIKDPFFSALKEAYEESGLLRIEAPSRQIFDIDIHLIPSIKGDPAHYHYDIRYIFYADEHQETVISEESNDLKWIPLGELEQYTQDYGVLVLKEKPAGFTS